MTIQQHPLADIERLIITAQHALDQQRYEQFANYFHAAGKLYRPTSETPIVGPLAIAEAYQKNPSDRVNRHLLTNIFVTLTAKDTASAITYVNLYSADTGAIEKPVFGFPVQRCLVGEFYDQFIYQHPDWKIAERRAVFVLNTNHQDQV